MSWSRFLIVRLVKPRQHTKFLSRRHLLSRPFRACNLAGSTFPGAPLLRRLPLAIIFRAVGAEIPVTTSARGSKAYRTPRSASLQLHPRRHALTAETSEHSAFLARRVEYPR